MKNSARLNNKLLWKSIWTDHLAKQLALTQKSSKKKEKQNPIIIDDQDEDLQDLFDKILSETRDYLDQKESKSKSKKKKKNKGKSIK